MHYELGLKDFIWIIIIPKWVLVGLVTDAQEVHVHICILLIYKRGLVFFFFTKLGERFPISGSDPKLIEKHYLDYIVFVFKKKIASCQFYKIFLEVARSTGL